MHTEFQVQKELLYVCACSRKEITEHFNVLLPFSSMLFKVRTSPYRVFLSAVVFITNDSRATTSRVYSNRCAVVIPLKQ